jgi:hypothetical protein
VEGIEPSTNAPKALMLPLHYTQLEHFFFAFCANSSERFSN